VKIIADTNVLVRGAVRDDSKQTQVADKILKEAASIVITIPCLCEFVWVLSKVYMFDNSDVIGAVRSMLDTGKMVMNRPAVEFGLDFLEAGGDFADGVIAYEGNWYGGELFVSFDKKAVKLVSQKGKNAQLLS